MFVVLYAINLYICVFMTCSTSYCVYDTYGSMECRYVCMHVCILSTIGILQFIN